MEDYTFLFDIGIPSTFLIFLFAIIGLVCLFILLIEKDIDKTKRKISITFLVGCIVFVISSTVIFRPEGHSYSIIWIPFNSYYEAFCGQYHLLLENFLNVLLFVPIGILFYLSQKKKKPFFALLLSSLMSILIEAFQFFGRKGVCEIDDIIHNVLGCLLGYFFCNAVFNKSLYNK